MAYDKEQIFEQAKKIIADKKPIFIDDLITYLPISVQTFYTYFAKESEELETLKALINEHKVRRKAELRDKWYNGENATTQVVLYKLLANEEELNRINNKPEQKDDTDNSPITIKRVIQNGSRGEVFGGAGENILGDEQ